MASTKYVAQLEEGEIITSDIYVNRTLLVKAGTLVNDTVIRKLQLWGVTKIDVVQSRNDFSPQMNVNSLLEERKKESIFFSKQLLDIKQLFYESLQYVVNESRYGYVLHNEKQLSWLENLFTSILKDSKISSALFTLKKVDSYSYFHSFDVFLLGSLLADVVGIRDVKLFATGCLIHDVGKLKIPRYLLHKEGKLSKEEFEKIQSHTVCGVEWLKENKLPENFVDVVKSHHERLDGSGYPEGLTGNDLSTEVRIMGIVDTYSALTLKRSYREPLSSTKAIELLLGKKGKYDSLYLVKFIELLNIYPADSIVTLSNGKRARIKEVNENQPYRPILEELDRSKTFELPTNLSVTIPRFVQWDQVIEWDGSTVQNQKEINWKSYVSNLVNGNRDEAIKNFKEVTEGMTVENIFIDVIVKSIKEIESKWDDGQLSVGEEHDALLGIKDILDLTLGKMHEKKEEV
ncbi:HD domain-containing phosphohydrolase [Bacillus sp. FJAT-45350]|uniref:HD domain-containing phosphohydrolase n=1 Tax=Bacillus sp. FJAT-45350 TaxID=2011014 RepID=UPI000BB80E6C|nr:HD domain-containing phosphohydrolase [Bacillus sp. FJAT-45350]